MKNKIIIVTITKLTQLYGLRFNKDFPVITKLKPNTQQTYPPDCFCIMYRFRLCHTILILLFRLVRQISIIVNRTALATWLKL